MESEVLSRARSVGGSLMVVIPKEVVLEEGIKPGELLRVTFSKPKKSFFGVSKSLKSFTKEEELKFRV